MALPININELLSGHTVEWDRIEFKKGWNPEEVGHTLCAFANDVNNWGGGYIFIGIEEQDGRPVLPPAGLAPESMDGIQKELLNLCHRLHPHYAPVTEPYFIQGAHILVIWTPGGDNRPYKAPTTLGAKGQSRYFVRRGSSTVLANEAEERLLLEMSKRIPFDDRIAHGVDIDELDFGLIREYLEEVKSELRHEAARIPLPQLALQMRIAAGPPEALAPLNAGLLMFSRRPDEYFRGAQAEVVVYEDTSGRQFSEKKFVGPLHQQLRAVLSFIQSNIIRQQVIKLPDRAEATRVANYPYAAVEEAIANAYYHRSYELQNPVEVNIHPDKMEVLSFPGPLPPITREKLKERRIVARDYRNRRVGDFFKELKLTEGRATGFPTIYDSMQANGSPPPLFETDEGYAYFLVTLPVHPYFKKLSIAPRRQAESTELKILELCTIPRKRAEIFAAIGLPNHGNHAKRYIQPLLDEGWLQYTEFQSIHHPNQRYMTTERGLTQLSNI